MKTNLFQLVEKRQNISAFSGIGIQPNTMILKQQQPKLLHTKTAILHALVQINALSTSAGTSIQSSEVNSQQLAVNMQKTKNNRDMKTEDNRTRTKWQLINLVLFFVIILWLNNTGLGKSPTSYITSNKSSIGNRSMTFPVLATYI